MEKSIAGRIEAVAKLENSEVKDIRSYSPLVLAYIGDAVYELMVRTKIVGHSNAPVNKLHKRSSNLVKAPAQAQMIKVIEPMLDEDELHVFKRGRNAKSYTSAKNASIIDYRMATGFEALIGYLYLQNKYERMAELVDIGINKYMEAFNGNKN